MKYTPKYYIDEHGNAAIVKDDRCVLVSVMKRISKTLFWITLALCVIAFFVFYSDMTYSGYGVQVCEKKLNVFSTNIVTAFDHIENNISIAGNLAEYSIEHIAQNGKEIVSKLIETWENITEAFMSFRKEVR